MDSKQLIEQVVNGADPGSLIVEDFIKDAKGVMNDLKVLKDLIGSSAEKIDRKANAIRMQVVSSHHKDVEAALKQYPTYRHCFDSMRDWQHEAPTIKDIETINKLIMFFESVYTGSLKVSW